MYRKSDFPKDVRSTLVQLIPETRLLKALNSYQTEQAGETEESDEEEDAEVAVLRTILIQILANMRHACSDEEDNLTFLRVVTT